MDWDQVRSLFPAALKYTYLNTAAAPPLSEFAAREGKRYYDEMSLHGDVFWEDWLAQVEQVRGRVGRLIGADQQHIAFTYSTSHGMNLVAGIVQHAGAVLCPADEFPSCTLPWLQQRYRVQFVNSREKGIIDLEDIRCSITRETRIV